jgi:hypothetical protein
MLAGRRWRDWQPSTPPAWKEVPEPPKSDSVSFVSETPTDSSMENGHKLFPQCPGCASYALYRKNNIGAFECLTCGLAEIEENSARRLARREE